MWLCRLPPTFSLPLLAAPAAAAAPERCLPRPARSERRESSAACRPPHSHSQPPPPWSAPTCTQQRRSCCRFGCLKRRRQRRRRLLGCLPPLGLALACRRRCPCSIGRLRRHRLLRCRRLLGRPPLLALAGGRCCGSGRLSCRCRRLCSLCLPGCLPLLALALALQRIRHLEDGEGLAAAAGPPGLALAAGRGEAAGISGCNGAGSWPPSLHVLTRAAAARAWAWSHPPRLQECAQRAGAAAPPPPRAAPPAAPARCREWAGGVESGWPAPT